MCKNIGLKLSFLFFVFAFTTHGVFAQQTAPSQTKVFIMPSWDAEVDTDEMSAQLEDTSMTKELDKSSPMLQQPSVGGTHDEGDSDQPIIEGRVYNADSADTEDGSVDALNDVPDAQQAIEGFLKLGDIKGESKDEASEEDNAMSDRATESSGAIILKGKKIRENIAADNAEVRGFDPQTKEVMFTTSDITTEQDLHDYAQALVVSDENIDEVSVSDATVSVSYRQPAKFLGIFQATILQTASVDGEGRVKARFPWYAFLYNKQTDTTVSEEVTLNFSKIKMDYDPLVSSDDDAQTAQRILQNSLQQQQQYLKLLTNMLKTKYDAAQTTINIVR